MFLFSYLSREGPFGDLFFWDGMKKSPLSGMGIIFRLGGIFFKFWGDYLRFRAGFFELTGDIFCGPWPATRDSRAPLFFERAPLPSLILTHLNVVSRGKWGNFFDSDKKLKGSRFLMV